MKGNLPGDQINLALLLDHEKREGVNFVSLLILGFLVKHLFSCSFGSPQPPVAPYLGPSFLSGWTSRSVKSLSPGYYNDSPHPHSNHSVICLAFIGHLLCAGTGGPWGYKDE